ncbi:MAG: EamA family transporter [Rhizobiaceae bacterium]
MSTPILIAILFAALLHAAWNALLKSQPDKMAGALAVSIGSSVMALICLAYTGLPGRAAWPLVAGSAVLHTGYFLFLTSAYRVGDLGQVYPVARGVAPLITAAGAVLLLGETLTPLETAAVAIIGLGLISLVLTAKTDGRLNVASCALALVTGLFISAYSLNDGTGARLAGNSLAYYSAAALLNSAVMCVGMSCFRRDVVPAALRNCRRSLWIGGPLSFIAYALITWAFTQAPIALVSALRETSLVFALIIGTLFLKERINLGKIISVFVTLSGAVLLRLQS